MTNAKEQQYTRRINLSNDLKRAVDLMHIQRMLIDFLVDYEDRQHQNNIVLRLDDMTSLNQTIIDDVNRDANIIVKRAKNVINS